MVPPSYFAAAAPSVSDADQGQGDDDNFGYEQEHSSRGPNVDDVILSVGHDFLPQSSSRNTQPMPTPPQLNQQRPPQRQDFDTPERFAATLQEDYDNETEFSIQPGVRRFFQAPEDEYRY